MVQIVGITRGTGFKIGKFGEKNEENGQEEPLTAIEVADIEEKMSEKTQELRSAEKQLKGLAEPSTSAGDDEDEIPGPHGPLIELTLDPENDLDVETDKELDILMNAKENEGGDDQEIKMVEVASKDVADAVDKTADNPAEESAGNEKPEPDESDTPDEPESAAGDSDDGFGSLFSQEEEEVNPLANLIKSVPDVSAQELLGELAEIKDLLADREIDYLPHIPE